MTRYIGPSYQTEAQQIESELKRRREEAATQKRYAKNLAMLSGLRTVCTSCGHVRPCEHTGHSFLCETCLSNA